MANVTWRFRWKGKADNPWRQEPFSVTGVPTLIKVTADGVSYCIWGSEQEWNANDLVVEMGAVG
jgi:hypothetical protein